MGGTASRGEWPETARQAARQHDRVYSSERPSKPAGTFRRLAGDAARTGACARRLFQGTTGWRTGDEETPTHTKLICTKFWLDTHACQDVARVRFPYGAYVSTVGVVVSMLPFHGVFSSSAAQQRTGSPLPPVSIPVSQVSRSAGRLKERCCRLASALIRPRKLAGAVCARWESGCKLSHALAVHACWAVGSELSPLILGSCTVADVAHCWM